MAIKVTWPDTPGHVKIMEYNGPYWFNQTWPRTVIVEWTDELPTE